MMAVESENALAQVILQAIDASGMTRYQIAQATGIGQGVLSRFCSGQRDLQLATASRLLDSLGLELRPKGRPRKAAASTAAQRPDVWPELLAAAMAINPRFGRGDLVEIPELRKHLATALPGSSFDKAVEAAVKPGRFAVHRFDRPGLLKPSERAELLQIGKHFHNAVSLWVE